MRKNYFWNCQKVNLGPDFDVGGTYKPCLSNRLVYAGFYCHINPREPRKSGRGCFLRHSALRSANIKCPRWLPGKPGCFAATFLLAAPSMQRVAPLRDPPLRCCEQGPAAQTPTAGSRKHWEDHSLPR